jgi:hypothetical protein
MHEPDQTTTASIPAREATETVPPTVERHQTLVHFLEEQEELFYVHDPPKNGIDIREGVRCKVLVVSSPHRGAKNALKNNQLMLYMPPWSHAELKAGNERLGVGLSDDVLEDRWKTFGGVARWALAANPDTGEQVLDEARRKLTDQGIARVLNPFGDHENAASGAKDISGLVVHMCPSDDFRGYTTRISTPAMLSEIRTKLHLDSNSKVLVWAKSVHALGVGINVGDIVEACWHNQLMMGGPTEGCKIRELTDLELPDDEPAAKGGKAAKGEKAAKEGKAAKPAREVTVPEFTKVVSFASPAMADLDALDVGQYAKPDDTNFRTVDSLALLEKPFCDPSNPNKCVVGFQMTVAPKHPLNNAGGLEIRRKFGELLNLELLEVANMYIVFVVPAAVAMQYKKQNWVKDRKVVSTPLSAVRQFVLVLPDT